MSTYAKHPEVWSDEYRARVRRAIHLRMWTQGYGAWAFPSEVDRRLGQEERGEKRTVFACEIPT